MSLVPAKLLQSNFLYYFLGSSTRQDCVEFQNYMTLTIVSIISHKVVIEKAMLHNSHELRFIYTKQKRKRKQFFV